MFFPFGNELGKTPQNWLKFQLPEENTFFHLLGCLAGREEDQQYAPIGSIGICHKGYSNWECLIHLQIHLQIYMRMVILCSYT